MATGGRSREAAAGALPPLLPSRRCTEGRAGSAPGERRAGGLRPAEEARAGPLSPPLSAKSPRRGGVAGLGLAGAGRTAFENGASRLPLCLPQRGGNVPGRPGGEGRKRGHGRRGAGEGVTGARGAGRGVAAGLAAGRREAALGAGPGARPGCPGPSACRERSPPCPPALLHPSLAPGVPAAGERLALGARGEAPAASGSGGSRALEPGSRSGGGRGRRHPAPTRRGCRPAPMSPCAVDGEAGGCGASGPGSKSLNRAVPSLPGLTVELQ